MHRRAVLQPLEFDDETVERRSGIVETKRSSPFFDEDDELTMIAIDVVTESEDHSPDAESLSRRMDSMLAALPTLPVRRARVTTVPAPSVTPSLWHSRTSVSPPERPRGEPWKLVLSWFAMGISIGLFITAVVALALKY